MEPSESSPLVAGGLVYVGDWGGRVSCFAASSGHLYWRFRADGKVKGGIALSGDRVYFGTYGSKVYALNAGNGKLIWEATGSPFCINMIEAAPSTTCSTVAISLGPIKIPVPISAPLQVVVSMRITPLRTLATRLAGETELGAIVVTCVAAFETVVVAVTTTMRVDPHAATANVDDTIRIATAGEWSRLTLRG